MVSLEKATDDDIRNELKKRGWCMVRPIKIEFRANDFPDECESCGRKY